jgi:hypothetical protein
MKPNQVAIRAWVVRQIGVGLLGTDFGMSGDRNNRAVEMMKAITGDAEAIDQSKRGGRIADWSGDVHRFTRADQGVTTLPNGVVPAKAGTHKHRWL